MAGDEKQDPATAIDPEIPLPMPKVEPLDLFLREKHADAACPICGTASWQIAGDDENSPHAIVGTAIGALQADGTFTSSHLRLLTLVCSNCYFVRFHSFNEYMAWLKKRQPEGADHG